MNRRTFLSMTALGVLAPWLSHAQVPTPGTDSSVQDVVMVEVINFHCKRCRAVNDYADQIKNAAVSAGVRFYIAPVAWEGQSFWPDKIYYSVKDLYPKTLDLVRDAIFDGIQSEGQLFEDLTQSMAFLDRKVMTSALKLDPNFNLAVIAERAITELPEISEVKAGNLLDMVVASQVPVFLFLQNGKAIANITTDVASEPGPMVNAVINKLTHFSRG